MIKLPSNWIDYALVNMATGSLLIYLKNGADQYFSYYHRLDPAFTLEQIIEQVNNHDFSAANVQAINPETKLPEWVEPTDQNWQPVLVPLENTMTLPQYRKQLEGSGNAGN